MNEPIPNIWLPYASATVPGRVSCLAQTFAGAKTLVDDTTHTGNISIVTIPRPGPCTATLVASAGLLGVGAYRYKILYVTSTGNSGAGIISNSITTVGGSQQINLTAIPVPTDARVTSKLLYRTQAGGSSYLLHPAALALGDVAYTDNIADASLGAAAPTMNTISNIVSASGPVIFRSTMPSTANEDIYFQFNADNASTSSDIHSAFYGVSGAGLAYLYGNGSFYASGTLQAGSNVQAGGNVLSNAGNFLSNAAVTATLKGLIADGAAAVGCVLDNGTTLSTAGAKIVSFRNNNVEKASIGKDGDIRIGGIGALPVAASGYRGSVWIVQGAAGVTDTMYVCLKSAADTYNWIPIVNGG